MQSNSDDTTEIEESQHKHKNTTDDSPVGSTESVSPTDSSSNNPPGANQDDTDACTSESEEAEPADARVKSTNDPTTAEGAESQSRMGESTSSEPTDGSIKMDDDISKSRSPPNKESSGEPQTTESTVDSDTDGDTKLTDKAAPSDIDATSQSDETVNQTTESGISSREQITEVSRQYISTLHDRIDDLEQELDETTKQLEETEARLENERQQFETELEQKEQRNERQIKKKEQEVEQFKQQMREQIDERVRQEIVQFAEDLLVDVRSSLVRALNEEDEDSLRSGIRLTVDELDRVLAENNIKPIVPSEGDQLDRDLHSVARTVQADAEPKTVVEVIRPGFKIEGEVKQSAQVFISSEK